MLQDLGNRARTDLLCNMVGATFAPRGRKTEPQAAFVEVRVTKARLSRAVVDRTWIQVRRDEGRWTFDRLGPERPYEEPASYALRRKSDRLTPPMLQRYLLGAGVDVDGPCVLDRPVTTVTFRRSQERIWSTIAELRVLDGYPPDGVVTDLLYAPPEG